MYSHSNKLYELQSKKWKYDQVIEELDSAITKIQKYGIFSTFTNNRFTDSKMDTYPRLTFYEKSNSIISRMNTIRNNEVEALTMLRNAKTLAEQKRYDCIASISRIEDEERTTY